MLTEIRFWAQVLTDSQRTIICPPDLAPRITEWVQARGMAGVLHIQADPTCPPGQILVIDHHASRGPATLEARRGPRTLVAP